MAFDEADYAVFERIAMALEKIAEKIAGVDAVRNDVDDFDPVDPEVLLISYQELGLSTRAKNALRSLNAWTVGDIIHLKEPRLLMQNGFGRKSLDEIKDALYRLGLTLGMP